MEGGMAAESLAHGTGEQVHLTVINHFRLGDEKEMDAFSKVWLKFIRYWNQTKPRNNIKSINSIWWVVKASFYEGTLILHI